MKLPKPISDKLRSRVRGIIARLAVYDLKCDAAHQADDWEASQKWAGKYRSEYGRLEDLDIVAVIGRYEARLREAERRIMELEGG